MPTVKITLISSKQTNRSIVNKLISIQGNFFGCVVEDFEFLNYKSNYALFVFNQRYVASLMRKSVFLICWMSFLDAFASLKGGGSDSFLYKQNNKK